MTGLMLALAIATQTFHLPQGMLSAVCFVESTHRPYVLVRKDGRTPSHGLCQVKEETARFLGFKGDTRQLMDPKVNAYYAAKYLRYQLNRYHGDIRKAVAAYNSGTYRENLSGQAVNQRYIIKVYVAWAEGR